MKVWLVGFMLLEVLLFLFVWALLYAGARKEKGL